MSKYRPDVPNGGAITLEQILTMRSGLFNYTETLELNTAMDQDLQKSGSRNSLPWPSRTHRILHGAGHSGASSPRLFLWGQRLNHDQSGPSRGYAEGSNCRRPGAERCH
ncbi:hypothetical protein [Arthrobacter sp. YN]|uniref:hypothetical protein n=1 Tax=Arthrobacter sp. YN TaxID=2020486 RepID=UPI0022B757CC|nr:hypothetical protein [Arthrobacter sp. YN]